MTTHAEAITVLVRQVDLLYYMRHTGDRAEMRRVIRGLCGGVRVLRDLSASDDGSCWHAKAKHRCPREVTDRLWVRANYAEILRKREEFAKQQSQWWETMIANGRNASPARMREIRQQIQNELDRNEWDEVTD